MKGKKIVLGVTGGIAAYKACALASKLSQKGALVRVVMTESAMEFVQPITFQALTRQPVYTNTFKENDPSVVAHIDVADWADLVLVAPATANVLAKMAHGLADDMLTTILLATTAPVWAAPAMNVHMYDHPAVKTNIQTLHERGVQFIEPEEGYLACGYVGKGRLEEPEKIAETIQAFFTDPPKKGRFAGKKVLITAGPTQERIDPVRYLTNRSSGKMGFALAAEAFQDGAQVTIVSGPVQLEAPRGVEWIRVVSAAEMFDAVMSRYDQFDVAIMTAAVADYTPKKIQEQKIKKTGDEHMALELVQTEDILRHLGHLEHRPLLIGFAAESERVVEYAEKKRVSKQADMIVANSIAGEKGAFDSDENEVTLVTASSQIALKRASKQHIAQAILDAVHDMLKG
ncbi:bifunctional phosphopantothenoylcysteine decarboxylase/phosphopantothenate--cysteine ligase CoaBC [Aureibacillus halotolerans]|uniref:Coenzyme A biosynthesis bifunctional protein CoaBC n=1 Tax=Aureibacillus halotolerans TaxID=1508390 RepID=A0A4V3D625_9BACI|nr:bifunctional phosphopantothenoylcysteine decarboxylase/phosphopantothenate--cysteine ligase CoaBC [Aureibacillus halotolerans]TDQ42367.1 phosphopantothenoylcysteine decarboxylase/phosphopantothenate--cysteine ligase [Aureibacillus halotolerans]